MLFSSSNFKRQNTIDAATIKENTARLATQNQRPISAQPKSSADSSNETFLAFSLASFLKLLLFSITNFSSETSRGNDEIRRNIERKSNSWAHSTKIHNSVRKNVFDRENKRIDR